MISDEPTGCWAFLDISYWILSSSRCNDAQQENILDGQIWSVTTEIHYLNQNVLSVH